VRSNHPHGNVDNIRTKSPEEISLLKTIFCVQVVEKLMTVRE